MDKRFLVEQLTDRLREVAVGARRAGAAAEEEARVGATASEKRENARVSQEYSSLARGQKERAARALAEAAALEAFRPVALPARAAIALGAIVEVEIESEGEAEVRAQVRTQGRTFFLAPAGAGIELTGPGGDGFLSVVTPQSPVGRSVLGRRVGDTIEVTVEGEPREWTITFVG
jgi:transcription elongation GreA/GreB family factor